MKLFGIKSARCMTQIGSLLTFALLYLKVSSPVLSEISDQNSPIRLRSRKSLETLQTSNQSHASTRHDNENRSFEATHLNVVTVGGYNRNQSVCEILQAAFSENHMPGEERRVVYEQPDCTDNLLGNRMPRIYMAWAMAKAAGASFTFQCKNKGTDISQDASNTFISLFQQAHTTVGDGVESDIAANVPHSLADICENCDSKFPHECISPSIDLAAEVIRRDYRSIAEKLTTNVGTSDVAIHYRCGDVLDTKNRDYGLLPHNVFARLIAKQFNGDSMRSISILTQPFDSAHLRKLDRPFGARCRVIVDDLVSYLQKEFPHARVSVYNDPSTESIAQTYARMITAKQTICGPSTFCVLATISSVGKGYILNSKLFPWISTVANRYDDVETFDSPKLGYSTAGKGVRVRDLSDEQILEWLNHSAE